jgi:hypothetical protein
MDKSISDHINRLDPDLTRLDATYKAFEDLPIISRNIDTLVEFGLDLNRKTTGIILNRIKDHSNLSGDVFFQSLTEDRIQYLVDVLNKFNLGIVENQTFSESSLTNPNDIQFFELVNNTVQSFPPDCILETKAALMRFKGVTFDKINTILPDLYTHKQLTIDFPFPNLTSELTHAAPTFIHGYPNPIMLDQTFTHKSANEIVRI